MKNFQQNISIRFFFISIFLGAFMVSLAKKKDTYDLSNFTLPVIPNEEKIYIDSPDIDLPYPIEEDDNNPYNNNTNNIDFEDPLNVKREVIYNPKTGQYEFKSTLGEDINYRDPYYMDIDEYRKYDLDRALDAYWKEQIKEDNLANSQGFAPKLDVEEKSPADIFGSNLIKITPQGSAELKFGFNTSKTENPAIPVKQRTLTTFDFDQQIQLNVTGSIGDKLKINTSYNTEATFDFENQIKLGFEGNEDDILQKIEVGNISYPVSNSLIQGSQSLFGIRSDLKFGKLTVSTVVSQQKGERKEINIKGGAQVQEFELAIDNYESNRHYFLNHYHRDNYDQAMSSLPNVSSQVRITRMEVWVTNRVNDFEDTRNIIGFADLGEQNVQEGNPGAGSGTVTPNIPYNNANGLYPFLTNNPGIRDLSNASNILNNTVASPGPFVQGQHYEKLENSRLLDPTEYTYNSVLGYISLNQSLNNDEILAVAYQYTYQGKTYQVGEFSTDGIDGKNALYLKLLRGTNSTPAYKVWDLMMKNVYSIGAYQVSPQNFKLDVWYNNPKTGVDINYIPQPGVDNKLVLQLIGSDIVNVQNASVADGVFDFIPLVYNNGVSSNGGTIIPQNGRIIFSKVEPFGEYLDQQLSNAGISQQVRNTIAYKQLYDSTKIKASQFPELNRFKIKGTYESSSSSEISLNAFNIPQGAVTVSAGGVRLIENQDFTVDYNLGRVKIINDGILNSGTPIKISVESNSLFSTVQKTMLGTHFDYKFNKNVNLGATMLRLSERPLTQKVNIGDEPIKNTMLGINGNFQNEVPFLTKLVDALPFIETKAPSSVTANLEAAYLIPGHSNAIGDEGNSYIDDFEGSQSTIDIRSFNTWVLASIPQGQPDLFPEASLNNDLTIGMNRALINWNVYDPTVFHEKRGLVPGYIETDAIQHNHLMRQVRESEVFPNRSIDPTAGDIDRVAVFNLAYFPQDRGPYNFDTDPDPISAGLSTNGDLLAPETRWGGIMRQLQTNDFENANIEYIQFWVMDPFNPNGGGTNVDSWNSNGGDLYFNLGNVSEDILKDGAKSFENGLTTDGTFDPSINTTTSWGRVPTTQSIVNAFDIDGTTRQFQDVGLDGLSNSDEANFFSSFVNWVNGSSLNPQAKAALLSDPSADDYIFFRDDRYDNAQLDVVERYKRYNGLEGNSPTNEQSQALNADGYPTSKTTLPDIEDINRDNNLSETESYYQYKVSLRPGDMQVGKNFVVDKVSRVHTESGKSVDWYQFKVPIKQPSKVVNNIQDFRSIRFMRIFMKGFTDSIMLRFARLELVRGTWRRYDKSITEAGEYIQTDPANSIFNIGAVNIEENSNRQPIKYETPPNIVRQINPNSATQAFLNEQSLELEVCGLKDGVANAAFRNVDFDVLSYKKIKMFVHGEQHTLTNDPVRDNDLTVFVRLGSDFEYNYYEYEMPLKITPYGTVDADGIWPSENELEIVLQDLKNLKIARNNSVTNGGGSLLTLFKQTVPGKTDHLIKVIGNPNLQGLKTIMIGVRNPNQEDPSSPWKPDDGLDKCAKVWFNELRMTDFDDQGGYAAQSRVQANLADFATVSLAGQISTPGFGSIEQRVSERQRETIKQVDATTSVQLGQFFGKNLGVQIPLFLGFSEGRIDPQFDPLNPDLKFNEATDDLDPAERLQRKKNARDLTVRRSFNLTNVRINGNPNKKTSYPWDIKNFSTSYSYNQLYRRDIQTDYNESRMYNGQLNYTYQTNFKPWTPFRNNKFLRKSKWFDLVRDFNLSPVPKQYGFRTNIDRTYNESKARDITGNALIIPQFSKRFTWDRTYDLKWDLMQSLKIDFNANNNGFISEQQDLKVNKTLYPDEFQQVKDSVLRSIRNFGENNHYAQQTNVTYQWPLRKIPLLDFMTLNTKYSVSYDWQRAPLSQDSLGNTIQNSRNVAWNGNLNMINLYNKVPYLQKVNRKGNSRRTPKPAKTKKDDSKLTPKEKKEQEKREKEEKKNKKKDPNKLTAIDGVAKFLMSLKTVTLSYDITDGILLPGYDEPTEFFGMSNAFTSPGVGFVFGGEQERDLFGRQTNNDFAQKAANNDWLVGSTSRFITQQHTTNHAKRFNGRASFEPLRGIRLELTSTYNYSENMTENFMWDSLNNYNHLNTLRTGNLSVSFNSVKTAFIFDDKDGNSSLFTKLLDNRKEASRLLSEANINSSTLEATGFYDGYDGTQQEVLIGAFISSYSGKNLNSKRVNPFSVLPDINWRLTVDGLSQLESLKKIFKSITFSHGYNSTLNIASFTTNLESTEDALGNLVARDQANNFIPQEQILTISITEQFSPLFKVDATWQNSLITKFEYKSNRNISLSLTNNQITEVKGNEITIGTGYRFEKVKLPFKIGKKNPVSDVNARLDFSLRNNSTIIRKIVEEQNQFTAGQQYISIKGSADYVINKQFTLRFYYDRVMTNPKLQTSFKTMNQNVGFALRINLFQ